MKRWIALLLSVTLLCGTLSVSVAAAGKPAFSDVPEDAWYADAVQWAQENGIVYDYVAPSETADGAGVYYGEFQPEQPSPGRNWPQCCSAMPSTPGLPPKNGCRWVLIPMAQRSAAGLWMRYSGVWRKAISAAVKQPMAFACCRREIQPARKWRQC